MADIKEKAPFGMSLDSLRYFCCVCERWWVGDEQRWKTGLYTTHQLLARLNRAGIADSKNHRSVATRIKRIEDSLKQGMLFNRSGEGFLGPTKAGKDLYVFSKAFLTSFGKWKREESIPARSGIEKLCIYASSSIQDHILPEVLAPFLQARQGNIQLRLDYTRTKETADKLLEDEVDLSFGWVGQVRSRKLTEEIMPEGFPGVLLIPGGHWMSSPKKLKQEEIGLDELDGEIIVYPDYVPFRRKIERFEKTTSNQFICTSTQRTVLSQVLASRHMLGIVCCFPWALEEYRKRGELDYIPLRGLDPAKIAIHYKDKESLLKGAKDLLEAFREHVRSLPTMKEWDNLFEEVRLPTSLVEGKTSWIAYFVSYGRRHFPGPHWFEARMNLLMRKRSGDEGRALDGKFVTLADGRKFKITGTFQQRPSCGTQHFLLTIRGDPGTQDTVDNMPFVAVFTAAVRLTSLDDTVCLLGNWSSRTKQARPAAGTMILLPKGCQLDLKAKQRLASYAIVQFLPNAAVEAKSPDEPMD